MKKAQHRSALLEKAKLLTSRQKDGGFIRDDLLVALKSLIIIDVEAAKDREARAIFDQETRKGTTDVTGNLWLDGMNPYGYEPDRLVQDDDGHVIEQDKALISYKFAEDRRSAKHVKEVVEWNHRTHTETLLFGQWVFEQQQKGRFEDLTFGNFVRETGLFRPFEETTAA